MKFPIAANRRMLPKKPHFFQPLLPGFERKLSIPVAFLKYLDGQAVDKHAQLRGRGGKVWPVKINGRTFADGWGDFVGDHDLHVGDFLVFKLEWDLMFDVIVLDHTACEKEYSPLAVEEPVMKIEPQDWEEEPAGGDSKRTEELAKNVQPGSSTLRRPYFEATMTHYGIEKSRLYIPKKFASHLSNRSCQMTVMNQQGRSWPVMLICRKFNLLSHFGGGWKAFCRENDIKKGDTIILELVKKGAKPVLQLIGFQANPRAKKEHHDPHSGSS